MSFNFQFNKRGQVMQVAYFIVILFACALVILLMKRINTDFYSAINQSGLTVFANNSNPTAVQDAMLSWMGGFQNFDYGFVVITIGLMILLIFTSFMIPTHPIFMVINFVGIFFLVFIGMVVGNTYGSIVAGGNQVLGAEAGSMTLMNFIMSNLPYIAAGIIFLCTIIMYIRGSQAGSQVG